MIRLNKKTEQGFTLIELIFATVFFSLLLVVVINSFVRINRQYTKGYNTKIVQDAARVLMDDIVKTIRSSEGPLIVYDEYGESPAVGVTYGEYVFIDEDGDGDEEWVNEARSVTDGTVLRLCSANRRFAWNEYNVIDSPSPSLDDGSGGNWNNEWPDSVGREHLIYYNVDGSVHGLEEITAMKTDTLDLDPSGTIADCHDNFSFLYSGTTTSVLSQELRIHDLDVEKISAPGSASGTSYQVTLVVATADKPRWLDTTAWTESWVRNDSIFMDRGINPDTGVKDDGSGIKQPICTQGGRAEFCKVVRLQTVATTRN